MENSENSFEVQWMTLPEASKVSYSVVPCGCNKEKGCKGNYKCVNASLKSNAACK